MSKLKRTRKKEVVPNLDDSDDDFVSCSKSSSSLTRKSRSQILSNKDEESVLSSDLKKPSDQSR